MRQDKKAHLKLRQKRFKPALRRTHACTHKHALTHTPFLLKSIRRDIVQYSHPGTSTHLKAHTHSSKPLHTHSQKRASICAENILSSTNSNSNTPTTYSHAGTYTHFLSLSSHTLNCFTFRSDAFFDSSNIGATEICV